MRTLQEWMGHRDFKTTLLYADYAPSAHEAELVNRAFAEAGTNSGTNLSATEDNSEQRETALASGIATGPQPPRSGCGPGGRGFESRRSPSTKPLLTRGFRILGLVKTVRSGHNPVTLFGTQPDPTAAQLQRTALPCNRPGPGRTVNEAVNTTCRVRIPDAISPNEDDEGKGVVNLQITGKGAL